MSIEDKAEDFASIYPSSDRHFAEECYIAGAKDMLDKVCNWLYEYNRNMAKIHGSKSICNITDITVSVFNLKNDMNK